MLLKRGMGNGEWGMGNGEFNSHLCRDRGGGGAGGTLAPQLFRRSKNILFYFQI